MSKDRGAGNVKWVEGLRGIASVLVICTHIARSFDFELFYPSDWNHELGRPFETPRIMQLPILRVPWQGRISVIIFAFLTGFVCALKPLRLVRQGNYSAAFSAVSKSALRRTPRLMIPATIALIIAWTIAQFGGTLAGQRCDSYYIRSTSPELRPTFIEEVWRLFSNFRSTWTDEEQEYDGNQWALLPLLKGSFIVYLTLFAVMKVQFKYRMMLYFIMYSYFWQNGHRHTETFGMQMFFGMALSDLSNEPLANKFCSLRFVSKVLSPILIFLGLYVASYPEADSVRISEMEWCGTLQYYGKEYLFPSGEINFQQRFSALGVNFICLGIWLSPWIKELLSCRPLMYLGRSSFAVYLTHGITLRTVLIWMVYGITGQPWELVKNEENGQMEPKDYIHPRGPWVFWLAIPIWIAMVYAIAHYWTEYVDSWCDRVVRRIEDAVSENEEKGQPLLGV